MLARAIDLNPLAAGADEIFQRGLQVERIAHLVKVSYRQIRALFDLARISG